MTDFELADFLPYQLAEAARRASAGFARQYRARHGITVAEWRVLAHLSQEAAVSVREIHRRVGMEKPKVSRAASRLEAAGLVTKAVQPEDRRLVALTLTEEGQALVADLAPVAAAYQAELEAMLGEEAAAFRAGLAALVARLGEHEG